MNYALELAQLTKTYAGGVKALRGIDLSVEAGDFYALLGPNGAGKSTTIGIISSLVNKTAGSVRVFGYDIDKDIVNAKRQLGLVPQEFNFNPFETVLQIVVNQAGYYGVTRREAMARAEKYLNQLDLWGKRNERARMLSGGMKRRLMIARALMHQPKLLILDEPTAGGGYRAAPFDVGLPERAECPGAPPLSLPPTIWKRRRCCAATSVSSRTGSWWKTPR